MVKKIACSVLDPVFEVTTLYDEVVNLISAAERAGKRVSGELSTIPVAALGFLRRIPGQKYFRPGPGGRIDAPSTSEIKGAINNLKIARRRLAEITKCAV